MTVGSGCQTRQEAERDGFLMGFSEETYKHFLLFSIARTQSYGLSAQLSAQLSLST